MPSIDPTADTIRALRDLAGEDKPVAMINLLRYRERAAYPADFDSEPCSGREAYQRYAAVAGRKIEEIGARLIWIGDVDLSVIAPEGEALDEALIVQYPSVKAFLGMLAMEDYRAATVHRTAALADSRLIATHSA
jgi:uncharacterized protein (DUF1330 family)